jgi:translation initiation factor IF-1
MRRFRIRSIVGDRVHVEMSAYDLSIGRVVYREKIEGTGGGAKRRNFRRR